MKVRKTRPKALIIVLWSLAVILLPVVGFLGQQFLQNASSDRLKVSLSESAELRDSVSETRHDPKTGVKQQAMDRSLVLCLPHFMDAKREVPANRNFMLPLIIFGAQFTQRRSHAKGPLRNQNQSHADAVSGRFWLLT